MSPPSAPFPLYRQRYLPALTPEEIAALPDKAWAPVLVTTGAIEQHGPHLPVVVDALMGQTWITRLIERLPADASCYVAPPITIGKSNEHTGFPGTLTISKGMLRALLLALARQIHAWGFRSMAVINTHGGNLPVITYTLREIHATLGLRAEFLPGKFGLDVTPQEAAFGYHANETETAWLLALAARHVHLEKARCEYPARLEDPGELRPENAPVTFSWTSQDLSQSGIMGDAPAGTAEKGERWIEIGAGKYAEAVARLCREMKETLLS